MTRELCVDAVDVWLASKPLENRRVVFIRQLLASGFARDDDSAEEIFSRALLKLVESRATVRPTGTVDGLFAVILWSKATDCVRAQKREPTTGQPLSEMAVVAPSSFSAPEYSAEAVNALSAAMHCLKPETRKLIGLLNRGLSQVEIAEMLEVSEPTISRWRDKALEELGSRFRSVFPGEWPDSVHVA